MDSDTDSLDPGRVMANERARVISAVPKAGHDAGPALARLDPVAIVSVVTDTSQPWWRRRPCALSLEGRIPDHTVPELWARVVDDGDVAEVRIALLTVLGAFWSTASPAKTEHRERAVAWLRTQDLTALPYAMDQAVIMARCRLGDLGIADALATLTYDPWYHRIRTADEATAALVAACGRKAVLGTFGARDTRQLVTAGPTAQARYFGLKLLAADVPDPNTLIDALHDEDIVVAHRAATNLQDAEVDDRTLLEVFDERLEDLRAANTIAPPLTGRPAAAAWALYTVSRRFLPHGLPAADSPECTERAAEIHARLAQLDPLLLPLPDIPPDVRHAILEAYLPGQRTTDPRLLLEGLRSGHREDDAEPENPARVREALLAAGLRVGEPIPIDEVYRQGDGSYCVLNVAGIEVDVCTFAPFARARGSLPDQAHASVESAGFRWIDDALSGRVFEGLSVYFFGHREPLGVGDLLFYWQD